MTDFNATIASLASAAPWKSLVLACAATFFTSRASRTSAWDRRLSPGESISLAGDRAPHALASRTGRSRRSPLLAWRRRRQVLSDNLTRDGVVRVRQARTRSCLRLHKRRSIKHSELRKSCGFLIGLYFGLYLDKSQSILIYAPDAALSES